MIGPFPRLGCVRCIPDDHHKMRKREIRSNHSRCNYGENENGRRDLSSATIVGAVVDAPGQQLIVKVLIQTSLDSLLMIRWGGYCGRVKIRIFI